MDKHMWWSQALKNSANLICQPVLAIYFNHWQIALFAMLFVSDVKDGDK